mmetsp:Transcript_36221/g.75345  ORF Transcript_36221/g.75345 Transcript_36221/m.75345 type:complete len:107 (-) Transcript_36221:1602-1922(-)
MYGGNTTRQRPVIAYSRVPTATGGGGGNVLEKYRNNIAIVIIITILYTAFLYRSGACPGSCFIPTKSACHAMILPNCAVHLPVRFFDFLLTFVRHSSFKQAVPAPI